jgi:simple sugar transport system permease protein
MLVATVILIITGYEALAVYRGLARGITTDIGGTVRWATPLIIAGLAVAVAFRAGVWNIGVDGQLYLGAITATLIGLKMAFLPFPFSILLAMLGGMLAGTLWALLAGFLKVQWGVNEVVTTILLNFVAILFTDFVVLGPLRGTGATGTTYSTDNLTENFWMGRIIKASQANVGFYIAIFLAILLAYLLFRTTVGYEFKVSGTNPWFAKYGGINVRKVVLLSLGLSGAIAGLVGVIEILGVHRRFPGRFSAGLGFDGIVVALLARNHPIGVIVSGLFFGALRNGAMNMERITDVPRAMVEIVQSIIILAVSAEFAIDLRRKRKVVEEEAEYVAKVEAEMEVAQEGGDV